jgi:hypothetical protein
MSETKRVKKMHNCKQNDRKKIEINLTRHRRELNILYNMYCSERKCNGCVIIIV